MKLNFTFKSNACLVSDRVLALRRDNYRGEPFTERLWRHIELVATAEKIMLYLTTVDCVAASAGVGDNGDDRVVVVYTWEDAQNVEAMSNALAHEQVVVFNAARQLFVALKSRASVLRELLQPSSSDTASV